MAEEPIYGAERIAEYMDVSGSTLLRMRRSPLGQFLEVGSMSNDGGGLGLALWSYPSSLQALKAAWDEEGSERHRRAAHARWDGPDVSSFWAGAFRT